MWYVVRTTSHVLPFLVILLIVSLATAKPRSTKRSPPSSFVSTAAAAAAATAKERSPFLCDPDKLMVYKVTLATHWSRTLFPKQYPEWRPPAQWSKVIGRSHDSSYTLFRISQASTEGFKEFTETGRSDTLDAQSQGEGGIFDEFNAPPVTAGEGKTEAEFFVDSNHSRVSLASRIVPSPDWFVGLDSFNLCIDGQWVDSVAIKVGPMDGGTDNGFTFTSPNWPSDPTEKIFRITSNMPNHPANSFYYPDLNDLPPIATFFFVKVKEYALAEIFDAVTLAPTSDTPTPQLEDVLLTQQGVDTSSSTSSTTSTTVPSERYVEQADREESEDVDEQNNETLRKKSNKKSSSGAKSKSESTKKSSLLKSLVTDYSRDERAKKNRRGRKWSNLSGPRHCIVSEWGAWSACSKSCGIGESTRVRRVLTHARRGGNPCPPLEENKWCGSSRDCSHAYFDW
ncbi:uncharacterized protein LOC124328524 isoform X2 [Daphnia pulicaria]|uniref:uncharacterized protein LOC124328524 isoform X2 n=1 Tax=Daphnia pulicaria TaxID=35523 RepID=UPI001EE9D85A|nr:uncharacterized protein LOC124328524 isoform X2 [Daphnia pulicaria]